MQTFNTRFDTWIILLSATANILFSGQVTSGILSNEQQHPKKNNVTPSPPPLDTNNMQTDEQILLTMTDGPLDINMMTHLCL